MDVTLIHSINETSHISMNKNDNFIHKYYAPYLSNNHEDISPGSGSDTAKQTVHRHKTLFWI